MAEKHYDSSYSIALDILKKMQSGQKINNQNIETTITANGTQTFTADKGYTGIGEMKVNVNVPDPYLVPLEVVENGVYNPQPGEDGFSSVSVNVPSSGACAAGVCFDEIGYTNSDLSGINADIAYSKQKLDEWDPTNTSAGSLYSGDEKLVYAPKIDTQNVTNMRSMFADCKKLMFVPILNTSQVTNTMQMFDGCSLLTSVPALDVSKSINTSYMFNGCSSLTTIPPLNTSSAREMQYMFGYGIEYAIKVSEISVKSATSIGNLFDTWGNSPVKYLLVKDLGTPESVVEYNFAEQKHWGEETDPNHPEIDLTGAAQTVVDSLLTYSFDRKAAGYADCTLKVNANIMNRLSEEQKGQIAAKGYILQA